MIRSKPHYQQAYFKQNIQPIEDFKASQLAHIEKLNKMKRDWVGVRNSRHPTRQLPVPEPEVESNLTRRKLPSIGRNLNNVLNNVDGLSKLLHMNPVPVLFTHRKKLNASNVIQPV
jgi:hypothetical protein